MSTLNFERTKRHLNAFDWPTLFIEELGWLAPRREDERPFTLEAQGNAYALRQVAHLGGVVAFEVESPEGRIPDAKARQALHRAVESRYREHLLLFVDGERKQTVWSYPKYDGKTLRVRSHHFVKGQPADLFLSKLVGITFDLGDLDEAGNASLARRGPRHAEVLRRVQGAAEIARGRPHPGDRRRRDEEALRLCPVDAPDVRVLPPEEVLLGSEARWWL